jgi:hypothetical protein
MKPREKNFFPKEASGLPVDFRSAEGDVSLKRKQQKHSLQLTINSHKGHNFIREKKLALCE